MEQNLLSIRDLTISVVDNAQRKCIVDGIDLDIGYEKIVALVGGSGSGKSTTGFSILGLLSPALRIDQGRINFSGENLLEVSVERMRSIRGNDVGMVFQEPLYALNPVFSIAYQIEEVLQYHTDLSKSKRIQETLDLLDLVGLNDPKRVASSFPHELSGGMRQRAMIAQAIAAKPKLIIADEPTSNLDVTLQAKIMELFKQLKSDLKLSILLITHDLGVVVHLADETAVMTGGVIVEQGLTENIQKNPQHAYTQKLMETV